MNNHQLMLSETIEMLMVQRDLRGMKKLQMLLPNGYFYRAANILHNCKQTILIGTGFPVAGTFETDGPVGAIALYQGLASLGKNPIIVCGDPLYSALKTQYDVCQLPVNQPQDASNFASRMLEQWQPEAIVSIERPGLTASNQYVNMRGEDISAHCGNFDQFLIQAQCPTIAIGDGGNEIGMGNVERALCDYPITGSSTKCDELLVADISNWAAYGILAFLSKWNQTNLLSSFDVATVFQFLSDNGSVDGVTRANTLTEDGMCFSEGQKLTSQLIQLFDI